jgi:hypothetical protein
VVFVRRRTGIMDEPRPGSGGAPFGRPYVIEAEGFGQGGDSRKEDRARRRCALCWYGGNDVGLRLTRGGRREKQRRRHVQGAQLKLAATESKPVPKAGFSWNFPGLRDEYVTRVAPGRPIVCDE